MRLLTMLALAVLTTGCAAAISDRPCPRVTPFSADLQARARAELATLPPNSALRQILDATYADRAYNRVICRR